MAKTFNDVVTFMRRILGEQDGNDPDATQSILLNYAFDFYKLIMGQDIKSFDLYTWFEFDTVVNQDVYPFKNQGYTNITPPAYSIDVNNANLEINWFQNPEDFYLRHPIRTDAEQAGRPFDLLFFNDEIMLRPKADAVYTIRIRAYKELEASVGTEDIEQDYFVRYIAYGSCLDYAADFGMPELYERIEPMFKRYKALVLMRKAKQYTTQRTKQAL